MIYSSMEDVCSKSVPHKALRMSSHRNSLTYHNQGAGLSKGQ